MTIHNEIFEYNQTLSKDIRILDENTKILGKRVLDVMGDKNLPILVTECTEYISTHLDTEGLFRIPGSKLKIDQALYKASLGCKIGFESLGGVSTACSVLKTYFRELPDTIFGNKTNLALKSYDRK
jgi:hypothetical protein